MKEAKEERIDLQFEYEDLLKIVNEQLTLAKQNNNAKMILALIKEKGKVLNYLSRPKEKEKLSDMKKR